VRLVPLEPQDDGAAALRQLHPPHVLACSARHQASSRPRCSAAAQRSPRAREQQPPQRSPAPRLSCIPSAHLAAGPASCTG
jgi:hypothetical protein